MDYFVDSVEGDDENTGTSPDFPWKTIAKVNDSFSLDQSGNRVCFRSGRGWKEQLDFNNRVVFGSVEAPFIITSYGDGPLPSISGADRVTDWVFFSGNIWVKGGFADIQEVYYKSKRVKRSLSLESMVEGSTFYDSLSSDIYVWLPGDVAPNSAKVEVTSRDYGIRLKTKRGYITIENIYATRHRHDAISIVTYSKVETTDITIQRCHTAFAGVDADYSIDSSDGIVVYGQSPDNRMRNLRILNNYSHHNLNCAVEIGKQDGALIAGNRFEYCSNGLELWRASSNCVYERNAVAHMNNENQLNRNYKEAGAWVHTFEDEESTNNLFRQNVFLNCKKGIQIWTGDASILQNSFVDVRLTAVDIKNVDGRQVSVDNNMLVVNPFGSSVQGFFIETGDVQNYSGGDNSFYSSNPKSNVLFKTGNTTMGLEQWKLVSGQDESSFQVSAILPTNAPVDGVVEDGAWWVSK